MRYLEDDPDVEVELTLADRHVDVVDEGYDAVIRIGPIGDTSLAMRPLMADPLVACASPSYLATYGAPDVREDLGDHRCLAFVNWSGLPYAEWVSPVTGACMRCGCAAASRSMTGGPFSPRRGAATASSCSPSSSRGRTWTLAG